MCKGKSIDEVADHLHYATALRRAAWLLGYRTRVRLGHLLAAASIAGLDDFGRRHAGTLVSAGMCTADDAKVAQDLLVGAAKKLLDMSVDNFLYTPDDEDVPW